MLPIADFVTILLHNHNSLLLNTRYRGANDFNSDRINLNDSTHKNVAQ